MSIFPDDEESTGNTEWARNMQQTIRDVVSRQAAGSARNVQQRLGPSELGARCDRMVVAKMTTPKNPQPSDLFWPSIIGTAVHDWLAGAFSADDPGRWATEMAVTPFPENPGHTDLYDRLEQAVLDHKILSDSSMYTIRYGEISRQYRVQLYLYALGCRRAGLPVQRIALVAYPRQGSSLAGIYVHELPMDQTMVDLLTEVRQDMHRREALATHVTGGHLTLDQITVTPGEDCHWCPFRCPHAVD